MIGEIDVGQAFDKLVKIPSKILQHHDLDSLSQIVLHELGHEDVFGLDKAVYLVDNPDFDCLKGVAGYSKDECKFHSNDLWSKPCDFGKDMRNATFNSKTQQFFRNGIRRKDVNTHDPDDLQQLGHILGMQNPSFVCWRMRHGNHGVLIFEVDEQKIAKKRQLLNNAGPLLSLC